MIKPLFLILMSSLTLSCATQIKQQRTVSSVMTKEQLYQNFLADEYEALLVESFDFQQQSVNLCKYVAGISKSPVNKKVVLTFDDGPSSPNTLKVLQTLRKHNIKATFFMKGSAASVYPEIVKQVVNEGHIVGNHSYTHPTFPLIEESKQDSEIKNADKLLYKYMRPGLRMFRFPYGSSTCHAIDYAIETLKYTGILGWHVDTCDWAFQKTGTVTSEVGLRDCGIKKENISNYVGHVLEQTNARSGGIILMHETNNRTVSYLEEVIVKLKGQGYRFVNMDDPEMVQYIKRSK